MTDLTNIDVESLTEEERLELRQKIVSRLGLEEETTEEKTGASVERLDLREELRKINEKTKQVQEAKAQERQKLTDEILEPYTLIEDAFREVDVEIDESMEDYINTLRKIKKEPVSEDADLMTGGPASVPATMADIASLRTSLASLGGGGVGAAEVESIVSTTVINNFGLTPLDSSGGGADSDAAGIDSADVVLIVDSDYVQQRLPQDVKVRFRLDATTPVVLNSSGVTSVATTGSGQSLRFNINFDTPFASADDYITMLTIDQEGTDRKTTLIPPVSATSRTAIVIQQNVGSVQVAVENAETADNQDEGVLNVKIFQF